MARKNLIRTSDYPYHIVARTNKKEWFNESLNDIWNIYCDLLYALSFIYKCEIHAFVLMNNHFHLLVSTPLENLDQAMLYLMRESSRLINSLSGIQSRLYSGRYKWSVISNEKYLYSAIKYVYQNPVRAGVCINVEDYRYSTIRMKLGLSKLRIQLSPLFDDCFSISHPHDMKDFCNDYITDDVHDVLKKAMSKPIFKVASRTKKYIVNEIDNNALVRKKSQKVNGYLLGEN